MKDFKAFLQSLRGEYPQTNGGWRFPLPAPSSGLLAANLAFAEADKRAAESMKAEARRTNPAAALTRHRSWHKLRARQKK